MPTALLAQQAATSWEFYPDTNPSTGLAEGFAVLGVPQTDDQAITLTCRYAPGAPMQIEASFNVRVSALQSGVPVTLQWQTAAASGVEQGEAFIGGISDGITLRTPLGSRLMTEMASAQQLTYFDINVAGQPAVNVALFGNRAALQAFTSHCAQIQETAGRVAAPAAAGALVPILGPAISGHTWSRYTEVRQDVFSTILEIVYGLPETDDVAITGQCVIGAQGPLVTMQVAADIEGFSDGAPVTIRLRSANGLQMDVDGSVVGTFAEFGVSGVELVLEPTHPAWQVIAGDRTVQFARLGGRGDLTITGNGPGILGSFLADCDQIADLTPESAPRPNAPIGGRQGFLSCDSFGRVASVNTGQPTVMTFSNESGLYRGLLWISGGSGRHEPGRDLGVQHRPRPCLDGH